MLDILQGILFKALHALRIVLGIIQVQAFFLEVGPLGVRLLGVYRKFPQAVGKLIFDLREAELAEEEVEDLIEVLLGLMG